MIKQQSKDWNGMQSFLMSFHQIESSTVYCQGRMQRFQVRQLLLKILFQSELRFERQWWMMRSKHNLSIRKILKYQLARANTKRFHDLPAYHSLLSTLLVDCQLSAHLVDCHVWFILMR